VIATLEITMNSPEPSALPRPLILVADADAETRALYSVVFGLAGCEVVEAADGRQALTRALMRPPALVVTEIRLPFLDGCALCELLRRDRATADVPVLVVTGDSGRTSVDRARETGADCVIFKPATPEAIVGEARRLLDGPREPRPQSTAIALALAPQRLSDALSRGATRSRATQTKALVRFSSRTPPARPPALRCPSCDHTLTYEVSHVGGVNSLHREQWDYFSCPSGCGTVQYRHGTRSVRRVE
jgi:CheY-like chemotaxis protein